MQHVVPARDVVNLHPDYGFGGAVGPPIKITPKNKKMAAI